MRWHLLALVPVVIGSIAQLLGLQGAFIIGAMGTLAGIAVSYAVMFVQALGFATCASAAAILTLIVAGGTVAIHDAHPRKQAAVPASNGIEDGQQDQNARQGTPADSSHRIAI